MARFGAKCPAGRLEWRTATLLGRVLAHELGHYLLETGHSPTGLMRQQFEAGDIWAENPEGRSLTHLAVQQLASRSARRVAGNHRSTRIPS
jgi:hypothetical protein